jgi:hypothetical protein
VSNPLGSFLHTGNRIGTSWVPSGTEIYTERKSHNGYQMSPSQVSSMNRHELGAAFARARAVARANDKVTEAFWYDTECSARVRRLTTRYVSGTPNSRTNLDGASRENSRPINAEAR